MKLQRHPVSEKQRKATRDRVRRYREKQKSVTDVTVEPENVTVTPSAVVTDNPYPGGPNCGCWMCHNYRVKGKSTEFLNHGPAMTAEELAKINPLARNRQALSGDKDYNGVALRMPDSLTEAPQRHEGTQPATRPEQDPGLRQGMDEAMIEMARATGG